MQPAIVSPPSTPSIWGPQIKHGVYLVGAPRCGTTTFSKVLARNPQICFSKPKENHFFIRVSPALSPEEMSRTYLQRYFPDLNENHRVIAEGSVSYLYSPEAIEKIIELDPNGRFIVMVRNPVDMIYSYHSRMLFTLDEDVTDFETAWNLQEARSYGKYIPSRCRDPRLLQYAAIGRLGEQVETLFRTAGRERCFVIVFDDFVKDPLKVYKEVLEFIDIDYDGQTKIAQKNQNRGYKSGFLQQFVMNPPKFIAQFIEKREGQGLDKLTYLRSIRRRLKKINKVEVKREALSDPMRQKLRAVFADDIEKLAGLLNRNFEHWR